MKWVVDSAKRANPWAAAIIACQMVIILLIVLGVGNPDEIHATNFEIDSAAADAGQASQSAQEAVEQLRQIKIFGVSCS